MNDGIGRRSFFTAGAGILAAPILLRNMSVAQAADTAEGKGKQVPQISQFKLGNFNFTVVRDGTGILEKPNETFGTDQKAETVAQELEKNFLPTDKIVNSYSPTLIDTGAERVLVDTGFGASGREKGSGQLLAGLKEAGYDPTDITIVALTHLHGDHIGGLMENGEPAFKNARYVTGETEFNFWTDKARQGTPAEGNHKAVMANVAPLKDRFTFLKDGDTIVSGMSAVLAPGHTPGHMIFNVESEKARLVMTGDTANHYILSLQHPDWQVRFDMDKAQAAATRRRVFDMLAAERVPFLGYHMPFPAVGFVEKYQDGYRFVPKTYQFDL